MRLVQVTINIYIINMYQWKQFYLTNYKLLIKIPLDKEIIWTCIQSG